MAAATTVKGSEISNMPPELRGTDIYLSKVFDVRKDGSLPLGPNNQVKVRTGTVGATGLTYVFPVDASGNINYDTRYGERDKDGSWIPTSAANSVGTNESFTYSMVNGDVKTNLNKATKESTSIGLREAGKPNNEQAVNNLLSGNTGNVAPNLDKFRPQGAPTLPGQSGGEADVTGTLNEVKTTLTSLQDLAFNIKGEVAESRGIKNLHYPEEWPSGMDYVKFSSKTYGNRSFDTKTFKLNDRSNGNEDESVWLPIQSGISDANSVGWNEETFNPAQLVGANLAISGINNGPGGFIGTLQEVTKKMTSAGNKGDLEKAIVAYFAEQAIGTQVLSRLGGAVFNPNTELLFQGPQLRAFNFTFKLTPRSDAESTTVKRIIGFFKRNMAPQTVESGLYLKAPKIFSIKYYHNDKEGHPGLGLIKDCALQSCSVDYTPDGSYMTFEEGTMVSYNLSLQFMELEPIYSRDYDDPKVKDHLIGY